MGVLLTKRDTFLNRDEYMQLLQLAGMRLPPGARIKTAPPSILAPVRLWTGKQVISTLLHHLHPSARSLNAECAAKTSKGLVGDEEAHVIIRRGELVTGVLDKAAFGDSEFGLVHSVHELLGGEATGALLTQLGKLFTGFQQMHGFTCGIADLLLTPEANAARDGLARVASEEECVLVVADLQKEAELRLGKVLYFVHVDLIDSRSAVAALTPQRGVHSEAGVHHVVRAQLRGDSQHGAQAWTRPRAGSQHGAPCHLRGCALALRPLRPRRRSQARPCHGGGRSLRRLHTHINYIHCPP